MAGDPWVPVPDQGLKPVRFLNPDHLLQTFGTIGLLAVVFAESGLLIGFFLPGDSLLFTAGLLASQGRLNLPVVLVGCFVAAVAGDQVGYAFGRRAGPALLRRPDSWWLKRRHFERTQEHFAQHGPKTVLLARFIPVVRTLTPVLAGVGEMPYRTFVAFNVLGGLVWAVGVTLAGFGLGRAVPSIDRYLLPMIGLIVVVSLLPALREFRSARRAP